MLNMKGLLGARGDPKTQRQRRGAVFFGLRVLAWGQGESRYPAEDGSPPLCGWVFSIDVRGCSALR